MNRRRVKQAKPGDTVQVHYVGRLAKGETLGPSESNDPVQFTIGEGQVIQGLEQAVIGMQPGEAKTTNIPAEKAYGPHLQERVKTIDRRRLPKDLKPEAGQRLRVRQKDGRCTVVTVTKVLPSRVTLDANPPLAGKDLVFDIQLLAIL
ncbi:MAG: peptidylprolyl isomerase [Candidatus Binatia bacterium]